MRKIKEIKRVFKDEPAYRLRQIEKAYYKDLISDWQEVTTLPANLRKRLSEEFPISEGLNIYSSSGNKKTLKNVIKLKDGVSVESVLMMHNSKRNTVCVSSQAGCSLGCIFCSTGKVGYKRNLSYDEIIEQVLQFGRHLKSFNKKVTNVVFMGMGEPFLNPDNVVEAIRILNSKDRLNIGARHISVSTAGIPHGIRRFADVKRNRKVC